MLCFDYSTKFKSDSDRVSAEWCQVQVPSGGFCGFVHVRTVNAPYGIYRIETQRPKILSCLIIVYYIDASVSVVESGVETGDKGTGAGVDGRGRVPLPKTVSTYVRDSPSIIYY